MVRVFPDETMPARANHQIRMPKTKSGSNGRSHPNRFLKERTKLFDIAGLVGPDGQAWIRLLSCCCCG